MADKQIAMVIDPLDSLSIQKDSSLALIEELQLRNYTVVVFETKDLYAVEGHAYGYGKQITIDLSQTPYYKIHEQKHVELSSFDAIFMRKDPPVNDEYVNATYILDLAQTRVINPASALRQFNEKAVLQQFASMTPPTLMTKRLDLLRSFLEKHQKIVVKPLNEMGGSSVFVVGADDTNRNVIFETMTLKEQKTIVAQKYLEEIEHGDQRILLFGAEPVETKLIRMPSKQDHRGNLAAGATAHVGTVTDSQYKVCEKLKPFFQKHQLDIVGLDMIGDWITEINITSPTCFREISTMGPCNVAAMCLDQLQLQ